MTSGKPDYEAVRRLTRPEPEEAPDTGADLLLLYTEILGHTDVTEDSSFVSLGGDSLCYVEMSLRLEEALGHLPTDWHTRTIRELRTTTAPVAEGPHGQDRPDGPELRRARPTPGVRGALRSWTTPQFWRTRRTLETGIALRAVGIVLIVGSHVQVFDIKGFAHILLGIAGYNFARFQLTDAARRERVRRLWRSIARIAIPSTVWITGAVVLTDFYDPANAVLLNSLLSQGNDRFDWAYWFVEALVYYLVVLAALMAVPLLDRLERRYVFGVPLALMAVGLVGRYDLLGLASQRPQLSPSVVFWLFALGWAAARAGTVRQRALLTAVLLLTVPGLFQDQPLRTALVIAGLSLLIWVPTLPSIGPISTLAGVLASGSLYIYLTHYQVYPYLQEDFPLTALFASLAVGVGYAAVVTRAARTVRWL